MFYLRAFRLLSWLTLFAIILFVTWYWAQTNSDFSVDRFREDEQIVSPTQEPTPVPTVVAGGSITFDMLSQEAIDKLMSLYAASDTSSTNTTYYSGSQSQQDVVRLAMQPADGSITGSYAQGFSMTNDAVVLGEKTTGEYVKSIVAGGGLQGSVNSEGSIAVLVVGAGDGIAVNADAVSVYIQPGGGLQFSSGAVGLLTTCSDLGVLKWNGINSAWECGVDVSGSGASLTVRESDGTPAVVSVSSIEFGPVTGSSDEFVVSDQGAGTVRVRTGSAVPLANAAATISGGWTFSSDIVAGGGLSCTSCIVLGTETSGDYVAGLLGGSGLSITGSGGEGSTPTVALDSSLAIFKTIDASLGTDPVADSLTDTLSLTSGNGINVTGDATTDSVSFGLNLASGSGLTFAGSALSLLNTCADGQMLAWSTGSTTWACTTIAGAANQFSTIGTDSGSATADATTDTVTLVGGNGLSTSASDSPDIVTLNIDLASGSGLAFSGGALSLMSCSEGQILKVVTGVWACASESAPLAKAFQQHFSGVNDVTVTATTVPLLKNGSNVSTALPITITSGNYVEFTATVEANTTLAAGAIVYSVVRDDNLDNDCVVTVGDGTRVGGWVDAYIGTPGSQGHTTTFTFVDTAPGTTTPQYQLCASTSIATGVTKATDRTLVLKEWKP